MFSEEIAILFAAHHADAKEDITRFPRHGAGFSVDDLIELKAMLFWPSLSCICVCCLVHLEAIML